MKVALQLLLFTVSVWLTSAQSGRLPWCLIYNDYEYQKLYGKPCYSEPNSWYCECPAPTNICGYNTTSQRNAICYDPTKTNTATLYKIVKTFPAISVDDCCDRDISPNDMVSVISPGITAVVGLNKFSNDTLLNITCKPGSFMYDGMKTTYGAIVRCKPVSLVLGWTGYWWNDTLSAKCHAFANLNEMCGQLWQGMPLFDGQSMPCQANLTCSFASYPAVCTLPYGSVCTSAERCQDNGLCLNGICTPCANCCVTELPSDRFVVSITPQTIYYATSAVFAQSTVVRISCAAGRSMVDTADQRSKYSGTITAKCGLNGKGNPTWINITNTAKMTSTFPPLCLLPSEITTTTTTTTTTSTTTTRITTTSTTRPPITTTLPMCDGEYSICYYHSTSPKCRCPLTARFCQWKVGFQIECRKDAKIAGCALMEPMTTPLPDCTKLSCPIKLPANVVVSVSPRYNYTATNSVPYGTTVKWGCGVDGRLTTKEIAGIRTWNFDRLKPLLLCDSKGGKNQRACTGSDFTMVCVYEYFDSNECNIYMNWTYSKYSLKDETQCFQQAQMGGGCYGPMETTSYQESSMFGTPGQACAGELHCDDTYRCGVQNGGYCDVTKPYYCMYNAACYNKKCTSEMNRIPLCKANFTQVTFNKFFEIKDIPPAGSPHYAYYDQNDRVMVSCPSQMFVSNVNGRNLYSPYFVANCSILDSNNTVWWRMDDYDRTILTEVFNPICVWDNTTTCSVDLSNYPGRLISVRFSDPLVGIGRISKIQDGKLVTISCDSGSMLYHPGTRLQSSYSMKCKKVWGQPYMWINGANDGRKWIDEFTLGSWTNFQCHKLSIVNYGEICHMFDYSGDDNCAMRE